MTVSRADRRRDREPRVRTLFPEEQVSPALDLLELLERAWHDCYGNTTPPQDIIDDVLVLSGGSIGKLAEAAKLAVTDWRDVKVAATAARGSGA